MLIKFFLSIFLFIQLPLLGFSKTISLSEANVDKLAHKNILFYSQKRSLIYLLGGSWLKRVPNGGFSRKKMRKLSRKVNKSKIYSQLIELENKEHTLFVKKKKRFVEIDITKKAYKYKFDNRSDLRAGSQKNLEESLCSICQVKISGNYVLVEGVYQINPEVSWVPYYKISPDYGFSFPLSASIYLTESDTLEETYSGIVKGQVLFRSYIKRVFLEFGGGVNYFLSYQDLSAMWTLGAGYIFKKRFWIISNNLSFTGLHFYRSHIFWRSEMVEYKAGVNFSF